MTPDTLSNEPTSTRLGTLHLEREAPSITGPDVTANTFDVLVDIARERQRQDEKWGEQNHDPEWWMAILVEEVGEAAQEVLGVRFGEAAKARGDLRTELLHVAAVAVSAIEALDYGAAGLGRGLGFAKWSKASPGAKP